MLPIPLILALLVLSRELRITFAYNIGTSWKNGNAFAALKTSGSAITWGDSSYGGDSSQVSSSLSSGVSVIYSTDFAFAALKTDGSVSQFYHEVLLHSLLLLYTKE